MKKIDYLEIRAKDTRDVIGIIDTAQSIIWTSQYYGVGDFEIYTQANANTLELLVEDNYVTRPDNDECGIIEHVEITDDSTEGKMIVASGRFIKSILDRRVVFSAFRPDPVQNPQYAGNQYLWFCNSSILRGNVETAVRKLIYDNAINAVGERPEVAAYRNIPEIYWTDADVSGITDIIVTEDTDGSEEAADKQVTYKNLLEYTDGVLQEYECGAKMWLDRDLLKFRYKIYKGVDRSRDSEDNEPIIFSKEFDNLISSNYTTDNSTHKTTALIGGEGEGAARKCAFAYAWVAGLERRETFVDASSIASTYTDEEGEEQSYSNEDYRKQLETQGRQTIASLQKVETFDGEIDLTNSQYEYGVDYFLGDIITVEDKDINKYINARILTVTEVQDGDGYKIDIAYGI